eukprot:scaffold26867_cov28-Tisochrysis_lutea.AAC.2
MKASMRRSTHSAMQACQHKLEHDRLTCAGTQLMCCGQGTSASDANPPTPSLLENRGGSVGMRWFDPHSDRSVDHRSFSYISTSLLPMKALSLSLFSPPFPNSSSTSASPVDGVSSLAALGGSDSPAWRLDAACSGGVGGST